MNGLDRGFANYGDVGFSRFLRRSFLHASGRSPESLDRPVIGIATSASDFNPCHRAQPELVASVERGVLAAGGLPMQFPTVSLGESFLTPTSMVFRNLMAMDVEEMVRAQPMDAVVLVGGCDKTVPAQLMGAFSAGRPAIQLVTGPMSTGRYHGERLGACTDCRRFWARYRAGEVDDVEIADVERNLATTAGTCAVMGTASTMACVVEALGMALPGSATAGAPWCSTPSRTSAPGSTTPTSTSSPRTCWSCRTPVPAARACRRRATCRSPRSSRARACATWCGSPTPG